MSKTKLKNIESVAIELKNKFNCTNDEQLKIGVIVCADNFDENSHAMTLGNMIKNQVLKNNADAEIVCIPSLNERFRIFNAQNYVLSAYKNQVANMLELVNSEKKFDGVVFVSNGFHASIGCLVSSIRLNLPTLVLPVGLSNRTNGNNLLDVLSLPGKIAVGEKSVYDLTDNINSFCEYAGSGATFNSENLFNIILEIMELVPKNSSTTNAQSFLKISQAREVASNIVRLTQNRLPLKKMINRKSLQNALSLNFCLGGNPTIIDALSTLALEADLDFDMEKVLSQSKNYPVLFNTNLGLNTYINYGGTWALVKAMIQQKLIDGSYKTFADSTLLDETKNTKDCEAFLKPIKKASICVLRGNIAERYAVVKTLNLPEETSKIEGNIKVFNSDEECCNAILAKNIIDGDIIVIKNCGKGSSTGCSLICLSPLAIKSMGIEATIVTDGLCAEDIATNCVSYVTTKPNSMGLKFLKDNDKIEIDFARGKINVDIPSREMTLRQKKYIDEPVTLPKYLKK